LIFGSLYLIFFSAATNFGVIREKKQIVSHGYRWVVSDEQRVLGSGGKLQLLTFEVLKNIPTPAKSTNRFQGPPCFSYLMLLATR